MKRAYNVLLTAAVAGLLAACSSTPNRVEELEVARAVVPQVESSPRAGVAASNVAEARKSLDRANKLADRGGKIGDIQFEAQVAARNAQIANEKILTAQAQEEIEKGTAERQAVLIEAREAESRRRAAQAQSAQQQAQLAEQRASTLEQELAALKAKKTDRGMVLTLGDVLFDTGLATLKPGAYTTVDRLATVLKEAPDRKVMIEGHTDSVGADDYNQALSERRATAVQTALLERGVRSDQIVALGKGESYPVASNDNAAGRQQNRRVEMIFTDNQSQVASDAQ
ncbi:OmpA family protein [Steroidobacter sp.]|uniref:OmpA family protein n=1 Tax=Steroidobacter sp. TaxID=1978227 RepID=UPI001A48F966|nr:OmpA family protein [Steroidobacter sp.]MBL8267137.1 OmpA family protein [Steroidobacter sp.]